MKVYKVIRDTLPGELGAYHQFKEGDLLCENGVNYFNKGYPLVSTIVEQRTDLFELLLEDNTNTPDYYIAPIYSQYQMDVKSNQIESK
jgi:hypothetical protein